MATISGAGQRREARSGGKMVRPRRTLLPNTPYDRPRLLNSTQQNPTWISRHVFSPTRTILTGASRMLASVLGFESSSSSSSSSECNSASDDTDDNDDDQDVSSQGVLAIEDHVDILDASDDCNDIRGCLSCSFVGHQREPQSFAGKNETKRLIEQLLMQESFSREECDKLTNIIKSRVVDSPTIRDLGLGKPNEMPKRTDVEIHDLCGTAVLEARKWLEEKKSGSNTKSELHHENSAVNSVTLTHGFEGEAGSPVDMAKSYMQTRPPWASPSTKNIEFRSPLPAGLPLFKEETPYSIGGNSLFLSKKRDSPATGSWNIQDEIRKVRSKATEEMLRTLSSSKTDWSSFALELKSSPDSLVADNLGPAKEDKPQSFKKPVDATVDLAAKSVSQITQDAFHNDALPSPATLGCEQNQVMEAIQIIEEKRASVLGSDETLDVGQRLQSTVYMKTASQSDVVAADVDHLKDSNGSILPFSSTREGIVQDSQVEDKNCLTLNEVAGVGGAASTANGFPSSGSNMSAELDKEQNHRPINEEDKAVGSGHDNAFRVAEEENCELLSEASIEVPMVNETDAVASDSQHSSSLQHEGSPQHQNTSNSNRSLAGKSNSGIEKQQRKKVSRYNRRGRGRGR
ncbi:protein KAKU4 isoform X2 [Durio zibethinus]|uniref:Protein KAKU4 isoform X2 n=1 Tax=Durio zibethinus TaxID=66656 RepID=A0A6P5XMD2_DURZI|nr:protein KAKU4 isoform X2 [Durio zibethinus]